MVDMDTLVSLCKRRGFIFQSSEIYGGLGSAWDYGPLGVELKRNIRNLWWRDVVHLRRDVLGLEAAVLMHPRVWEASGHLERFSDPMVDCKACKRRFRADQIDERPWVHYCPAKKDNKFDVPAGEPCRHCGARRTLCPECGKGELTEPRQFNLMLKTFLGPVEDAAAVTLPPARDRPGHVRRTSRTCVQSMRRKLPFGIAQIGRSFRNEITPGQLHLPDARVRADGAGVLREPARHGRGPARRRVVARPLDRGAPRLVPRATGSARRTSASASTPRRSWRTTPSARWTSSTGSPSAGASWRASRTAPTSTSSATPR